MKNKVLFLILGVVAIGCSKDDFTYYTGEELANEQFYPYFELFVEEANKRGYDFKDYHVDFYFADIEYQNANGLSQGRSKIIIDREYWNGASHQSKQFLIFHELGHAVLNREHKNEITGTGECSSIMKGTENDFRCSMNLNSSYWWEYYLDELFTETSPLPGWYLENQIYELPYANKKDLFSQINISPFHAQIDLDTIRNFVLEIEFSQLRNNSNSPYNFTSFIEINGYYFNAFKGSPISLIRIKRDLDRMFEKRDYNFNENVKFTIRKNDDLFQFFIDEQFLHVTDISTFDNFNLTILVDNELNEVIPFEINMFQFE